MPNPLQTRDYWRTADEEQVEQYASGLITTDSFAIGLARAELKRRDREYAEAQEAERQKFQRERFDAEADLEVKRRQFDKALADEQMSHAARLAAEQHDTARSAAK